MGNDSLTNQNCDYSMEERKRTKKRTFTASCVCVECSSTNSLLSIFMQNKKYHFDHMWFLCHFRQRLQLLALVCVCLCENWSFFLNLLILFQLSKYYYYASSRSSSINIPNGNYAQICSIHWLSKPHQNWWLKVLTSYSVWTANSGHTLHSQPQRAIFLSFLFFSSFCIV